MDLQALGYDNWFAEHAEESLLPGQTKARVTAVDRDSFLVRDENGETPAELAGKLRFTTDSSADLPCVGDWVCVAPQDSKGPSIIHGVLPRRSYLRRKRPGKIVDFQMIGTNIDVAFIVQACHYDFNVRRLDRYLVMANEGNIEPIVILSKTDLITPEELDDLIGRIQQAGIFAEIISLSNTTGHGLDDFRKVLVPGKTFCLLGSSGVGKTTLINRLLGRDEYETKAVSGTGEGVHTTSRRHLLVLDNGAMLMDTPGMRELGLIGATEGMEDSFGDIQKLSLSCRFSNCTHTKEPGCAILAAMETGALSTARFQSYLKLQKETDFNDLSYVQKRKKDRDFGKFVKSVMKRKKNERK